MNYIRNQEVKTEIILCVMGLFVGSFVGFVIGGIDIAVVVALTGMFFCCVHFVSSYHRYRKIAKLSEEISCFLHGHEELFIKKYQEGELAILESEIMKMVFKLKNQAELLEKDKCYLSDSIADISHQLRTPLTTINLIVSRLSVQEFSTEKRKKLVQELETMLLHVDWLVQSLLTISKLDAGTIHMENEKILVKEWIRQATTPLEIPMELREQQCIVTCQEEVTCQGDIRWLVEALANVLKNCMEHTPKQGHIWVDAVENSLYTEVVVRDDGPGISAEDLPHLFERFYKGQHASDQSAGIGLALSKMIVTTQGGIMTAENDRHGGAKFVIRFYKTVV